MLAHECDWTWRNLDEVSGTIIRQAPASSLAGLLPRLLKKAVGCAGSISLQLPILAAIPASESAENRTQL